MERGGEGLLRWGWRADWDLGEEEKEEDVRLVKAEKKQVGEGKKDEGRGERSRNGRRGRGKGEEEEIVEMRRIEEEVQVSN